MVNRKPAALGPVSVELADVIEARRIVVRGLEVLRLKHLVRVGKAELPELLFTSSATQASDIGARPSVACNKRRGSAAHESAAASHRSRAVLELRGRGDHRGMAVHSGRVRHVDRLRVDNIGGLLGSTATKDGLL